MLRPRTFLCLREFNLPVKLVVGKSSSRVNERMGRVPIWKFPDLTHELGIGPTKSCCRRKEKGKKSWEEKRGCTRMGLETNSEEEE
jgi:hypothetical protein